MDDAIFGGGESFGDYILCQRAYTAVRQSRIPGALFPTAIQPPERPAGTGRPLGGQGVPRRTVMSTGMPPPTCVMGTGRSTPFTPIRVRDS